MFNAGDLVKVKEDANLILTSTLWVDRMNMFLGGTYHIKDKVNGNCYVLEECISPWCDNYYKNHPEYSKYWEFAEEWLEEVYNNINIDDEDIMKLFK